MPISGFGGFLQTRFPSRMKEISLQRVLRHQQGSSLIIISCPKPDKPATVSLSRGDTVLERSTRKGADVPHSCCSATYLPCVSPCFFKRFHLSNVQNSENMANPTSLENCQLGVGTRTLLLPLRAVMAVPACRASQEAVPELLSLTGSSRP